jgi:magnesium chelatase family protein
MAAIGAIPPDSLSNYTVLGELALDGTITAVAGVLPAAIAANARGHGLICPHASGPEAAWAAQDIDVLAPLSLIQLVNHFKGTQVMAPPRAAVREQMGRQPDLGDIKGQESAKRALEIAAAGGHNLLLNGPPGAGKSMPARRRDESLPLRPRERARIYLQSATQRALHCAISGAPFGALARPHRSPC